MLQGSIASLTYEVQSVAKVELGSSITFQKIRPVIVELTGDMADYKERLQLMAKVGEEGANNAFFQAVMRGAVS